MADDTTSPAEPPEMNVHPAVPVLEEKPLPCLTDKQLDALETMRGFWSQDGFRWYRDDKIEPLFALAAAEIRARRASRERAAAPEGWKLVPIEPTREMLHGAVHATFIQGNQYLEMKRRWNGFLGAAPVEPDAAATPARPDKTERSAQPSKPQPEPTGLTDEQIERIARDLPKEAGEVSADVEWVIAFARAILAAPPADRVVQQSKVAKALEIGRDAALEVLNETINKYTSPDGTVRDFRGRITRAQEDLAKIDADLGEAP